ncbi:MAG: V-type ATP synthase subunit E family protein [Thermoplasmata archaeon]|jgi:vacuolar-type H+-ATPase subunit E/Vma4
MSLERLVGEIRARAQLEIATADAQQRTESARIAAERDRRLETIRSEAERTTQAETSRERAQRLAAAKLKARQSLYEAREARLTHAIQETRTLLSGYTNSPEYPKVLDRMVAAAREELGTSVRISGRAEDAERLRAIAGESFDGTPRSILGGLIAETPRGDRRLNFSFDELLRLREDRVRELLA